MEEEVKVNEADKIPEKYLPLGTVVLLNGGKKELMIISYCIIPTGAVVDKDGLVKETKMFDYGACAYPEGLITSDQLFAFNHDQIGKICYMGYESDEQKEFNKYMHEHSEKTKEFYNKIKEEREKIENNAQEAA